MRHLDLRTRFALALALCVGCNDGSTLGPEPKRDVVLPQQPDSSTPTSCVLPSGCVEVVTEAGSLIPCCTPTTSCGYLLPEADAETLKLFPQAKDFYAMLTKDDPNGHCAPEWFFFGPRPGQTAQRFPADQGDYDILLTPDCTAFSLVAFNLPGCCLPDNTCGLSTHSSGSSLEYLANDPDAPFAGAECVSPDVLNQQLRDSNLPGFARTTTSGSCNFAELDATLEHWF